MQSLLGSAGCILSAVIILLKLGKGRDEINVVSDQIGSPTYATDLAGVLLEIINNKNYRDKEQSTEIYHYSNEDKISWYDFAKEIFKIAKIDCVVNPVTTDQYPTPAKRPRNTFMDKNKIFLENRINTVFWSDSLEKSLLKI